MTATAIKVKSQLSQNIIASIPTMVSKSTAISKVAEEAKAWMVSTSPVIVLSSAPVWCLS